ncbi:NAD(P)/FAD-dependent oxidoreductase [Texcoconibacillus texcoconensis]|uniref:NADH dehydrogenase n=1 Tax=Texcoconibacillus texcoconensis TaxID=1095777 RepID=A0A840QQH8_9BACI|nr:NAD(P)/FAD-dependent oxidoreductase [Texcoconibacillus texcoconensis]MBB5173557.1 NADH dehydrogenase [Texcoconibacillus texcoconensis]
MERKPRIVILGAGYGGMVTASRLQKANAHRNAEITLVNKHNYHYQTTWLHEPAAGTLHHDRTRMLIDSVIDTNKINFIKDDVTSIDREQKKVQLANRELEYDYLVIGLGSIPETFGIPGVYEHAFSIRSVNSVRLIREHIEYMFANYNNEEEKTEDYLTFVVAGAGFTGMEFLGELTERIPALCQEYDIDREKVKVYSIEAAPTALPGFDDELVEYGVSLLESRGVEFKISTPIKEVREDGVLLDNGEEIKSQTVVWTTGVRGNPIVEEAGFETMRGRVKVEDDLRAPGHDDVFIIGDCALIINEETNRPYPPTAQIAIQQANVLAENLQAILSGKDELKSLEPDIKGTVASLGGKEAIGVVGSKKLFGTQASAMKKVIDNRYLYILGGVPLVFKKGKLNFFS